MTQIAYVCLALGFVMMFLPYFPWFLLVGWRKKSTSPSDDFLVAMKLGGTALTVISIVLLWGLG